MRNSRSHKSPTTPLQIDFSLPSIHKKPLVNLPKSTRYNNSSFYDQLTLSPQYIKISKTQQTKGLSSSRVDSLLPIQSFRAMRGSRQRVGSFGRSQERLNKLAEEDRVRQKYQENGQKYQQLVAKIKRKVNRNRERASKQGIELIYDKLMKLL